MEIKIRKHKRHKGRKGKSSVIIFLNKFISKSFVLEKEKILLNNDRKTILDFFCIKSSQNNWYTYGIPKRIKNSEKLLNLIIEKNKQILLLEKQLKDFLKGK